eukprot:376855_1
MGNKKSSQKSGTVKVNEANIPSNASTVSKQQNNNEYTDSIPQQNDEPKIDRKLYFRLLIAGYIRNETNEFTESLNEIIFCFLYRFAKLLPFNTSFTCDKYSDWQFKLSNNNCKATKLQSTLFCWMVSDIENGKKEGIHVWRFKIINSQTDDIMWGISPFEKQTIHTSYSSPNVYAWHSKGALYAAGVGSAADFKFQDMYRSIILDVKLDCDANKLSFVPLELDWNTNKELSCIGLEYVCDNLPETVTKNEGWVPHFLFCNSGTAVSICEIHPSFYGCLSDEVDQLFP